MAKELSLLEIVIDARIDLFRQELIEAIESIKIPEEYAVGNFSGFPKTINGFRQFRDSIVKAIKKK